MRRSCTDRRTQQFQQWYSTTWSSSSSANLRREVRDIVVSDLWQNDLVDLLSQITLFSLGKVGTEWRHREEFWVCCGFCVEKDVESFEERALPQFGFMTSYHALLISAQIVCHCDAHISITISLKQDKHFCCKQLLILYHILFNCWLIS